MVADVIKDKQEEALALARDFADSAPDYARISDYSLWADDQGYGAAFEESLDALRLFRVTQMNPLLLNAIQKFPKPADIEKTFRIVANFAFRYFLIGNQSPGNLERVSANIAYEIRANTYTSPKHVADALRAVNSDPTFRSNFALANIEGRKLARYTLAKITNQMARQASQGGAEQVANPYARQVNLEHVLPEGNPSSWRPAFSKGANPADHIYRLGNLTLLLVKVNRDAADKSFADKKRLALDASKLKINDFFRGASTWSEREIEHRQEGLAKTALDVWKL